MGVYDAAGLFGGQIVDGRTVVQVCHGGEDRMGGGNKKVFLWAVETFDSNPPPPPGLGMHGVKRLPLWTKGGGNGCRGVDSGQSVSRWVSWWAGGTIRMLFLVVRKFWRVIFVTLPMASILEVAELVRHREACGRRGIQAAFDWPDRAVVPLKVETPLAG